MKSMIFMIFHFIVSALNLAYIYSPNSPAFFYTPMQSSPELYQFFLTSPSEIPSCLDNNNLDLIYDLTKSPFLSIYLQDYCNINEIIYLQGYFSSRDSLQLAYPPPFEIASLESLLEIYKIETWAIIYTPEFITDYSSLIQKAPIQIPISETFSPDQILSHLNVLKLSRATTSILLLPPEQAALVLQVCSLNNFFGYIWFLSASADYLQYSSGTYYEKQGVLRISLTQGKKWEDLVLQSLLECELEWLNLCLERLGIRGNHLVPNFYLLNVVDSEYVPVGICDPECLIEKNLTWPDGLSVETIHKKKIKISYEGSLYDPLGNYLSYLVPAYQGVELGIEYSNNNTSLFELDSTILNLGGDFYDKEYMNSHLASEAMNLGNVVIAPPMSDLAVNLYATLKNQSKYIPMIGYSDTVSQLSSSIDYPQFVRVCMPDSYMSNIIGLIIKYFNWSKVGVIYIDNLFSNSLNQEFETVALSENIEILNKGKNQLSGDSSNWTNADLDPVLTVLGESRARIIIVFCYTNEIVQILIRMYELGYYGSDYEYIAVGWLVDTLLNPTGDYNETSQAIIRQALTGSLMFFPVSFIGEFGSQISDVFTAHFNSSPVGYSAFAFDSALAVSNAVESLILSNKDYTNNFAFMQSLRNSKFLGTTGPVTFQENNNDRSPMDHYIINTKVYNDSVWEVKTIGLFSPAGSQVFSFYENITWPGNSMPLDTPLPNMCPFPQKSVRYNSIGIGVLVLVVALVMIVSISAVLIGWKRHQKTSAETLGEKKYLISFYDILAIFRIFVEFFQYLGLLPSLPTVLQLFEMIGDALSLNLETIYTLDSEVYWRIYQIMLSILGFLLFARFFKRVQQKVPHFPVMLYIFGDILYISSLSTLLNIYLCYQSSFDVQFLHYDCYTMCWGGLHTIYVIFNSLVLFFFSFVIVLEMPKWNSVSTTYQHIFITSKQTYIKTLVQCFLVCIKKFVWMIGPTTYSVLLVVVFVCYLLVSVKHPPYNTAILNLWLCISYAALAGIGSISLMSSLVHANSSPIWLIILIAYWAALLIFGAVYQKHKKMVWPFINDNFNSILLKFAFHRATFEDLKKSVEVYEEFTFRPKTFVEDKVMISN